VLKNEMGFKGIVATDAMEMGALTRLYPQGGAAASGRAAVDAVKAGNDMLLLPSDLEGAYNGVLRAVRLGEISEKRIDESVLKILRAKAMTGLNKAGWSVLTPCRPTSPGRRACRSPSAWRNRR